MSDLGANYLEDTYPQSWTLTRNNNSVMCKAEEKDIHTHKDKYNKYQLVLGTKAGLLEMDVV